MSVSQANARDDEALLRMYASNLLEEEGFAVLAAADAEAALNILEARPDVRLLFTDIQMPGGCDGIDLARKVHARLAERPVGHHLGEREAEPRRNSRRWPLHRQTFTNPRSFLCKWKI